MKKAFLVTSTIDVDERHPLTYSHTRSKFSAEERLKHTVFTIASLDHVTTLDDTIFLIDASENYQNYKNILSYQSNLVYISVREEFPEIYNITRSHPNKSFCESLLLVNFIQRYKEQLKDYDYYFKFSGRYFVDSSFDTSALNEENLSKLFFKTPLEFEWNNNWPYSMVDRRSIQGNNKLYQYCSVLYGWGSEKMDRMLDIFRVVSAFTNHPDGIKYDIETLLYYFTRPYEQDIVETRWKVYGWEGVNGTFLRY